MAKTTRRLVSAVVRGRRRELTWVDDRSNLRDLLLRPSASIAQCPLCRYRGPFLTFAGRRRELCLRCRSRARHRALAVALDRRFGTAGPIARDGLHLAPDACLQPLLDILCERWVTADLEPIRDRFDLGLDLTRLPFSDARFDLVVASHVLEHIVDDRRAIDEIRRVLRPGGTAILVVPLVADRTQDFGVARDEYNDHARDCGVDYFDRYREAGFEVEVVCSDELPGGEERGLSSTSGPGAIHHIPFCVRPREGHEEASS
ncbi:MAG: methyltransferase domain-containing protein [Acidobacteriota bacterium]